MLTLGGTFSFERCPNNTMEDTARLFRFSHNQWGTIALVTILCIPAFVLFLFFEHTRDAWVRRFVASGVQKEFGFTVDRRPMFYGEQRLDVPVISTVEF